jgi:ParB family transcriptional regulator, chromosome partitioning protein
MTFGNKGETAKVQKGIIKDFMHGANGREHKMDWLPSYFKFPPKALTERGGVAVADKWQGVADLLTPAT